MIEYDLKQKTFIPYYNSYRTVTNDSKTITTRLTTQTALEAPWVLAYEPHDGPTIKKLHGMRESIGWGATETRSVFPWSPKQYIIQTYNLCLCVCTFKTKYM